MSDPTCTSSVSVIFKCTHCHHEWQGVDKGIYKTVDDTCDWCGFGVGKVLGLAYPKKED